MKKYALHPGPVNSRVDGEQHYVGIGHLAELYRLSPKEYVVWDSRRPETYRGRNWDDYIHLYPRYDGKYGRPDA